MGMGSKIYAINDNIHIGDNSLDDRTGFNAFLKNVSAERARVEADIRLATELDSQEPHPFIKQVKALIYPFLGLLCIVAILGLFVISSPLLHIVSVSALIVISIILSGISAHKAYDRLQALSLITGVILSFGLMAMVGDYFAVTFMKISNDSFWMTATSMSLAVGTLLKSRAALMLSIATAALWGYGYLSGSLSPTMVVIGFPLIAMCQILLSGYLVDRIAKFASVLMFWIWGGTVLSMAYAAGLLVFPMMISGLMIGFCAYYVATAHMFDKWGNTKQKPTRPWAWMGLMGSTLLTVLWLYRADLFPTTGSVSPLTKFIWQLGLIGGSCLIISVAFLFRSRQSYSLSRRLLTSLTIMFVAIALYYQSYIETFLGEFFTDYASLLIFTSALGAITLLASIKLLSAIKNDSMSWIVASLFALLGVLLLSSQIEVWSFEIAAIFVLGMSISLCGIKWTQKHTPMASSIYRPLNDRDTKQCEPIYDYEDMAMNGVRAS